MKWETQFMTGDEAITRLGEGEKAAPLAIEKWQRLHALALAYDPLWRKAPMTAVTCALCIEAHDNCNNCALGRHRACMKTGSAWDDAASARIVGSRPLFLAACTRMINDIKKAEAKSCMKRKKEETE